jgi:hypothetical protein
VLSHLEKVQQLPAEVQAQIAGGVDNYIKFARTAKDNALASMALEEQAKAIGKGASTTDPRWAVPAIAEAWCYATISLLEGYRERLHAEAIIGAIEAFTSSRSWEILPKAHSDAR